MGSPEAAGLGWRHQDGRAPLRLGLRKAVEIKIHIATELYAKTVPPIT